MPLKDKQNKKRIEYHGKNLRISRTSGVSATTTITKGDYAVTANTKHGIRLHKRLLKGVRLGIQNSNLQLIARYRSGPFNFNISKTSASTSLQNKRGAYNILKPQYSSFKLAGIQLRGKNAATLQLVYMIVIVTINILKLLWHLLIIALYLITLLLRWVIDFMIGFIKAVASHKKKKETDLQPNN